MIHTNCCSKSAYSLITRPSTNEVRKDPSISQWQVRSRSSSLAWSSPKVGVRLDNRSTRWQKKVASFSLPQSINVSNVYMYHCEGAMLFGPRDPIESIHGRDIEIPQIETVRAYLDQYPELSELLNSTSRESRQTFGPQAQLSLEIYHDIETNDEYLTLYVRQSRYDPDTMKRIKQIRRKYRGLAKSTNGRFLLTTDFRSPR